MNIQISKLKRGAQQNDCGHDTRSAQGLEMRQNLPSYYLNTMQDHLTFIDNPYICSPDIPTVLLEYR